MPVEQNEKSITLKHPSVSARLEVEELTVGRLG